MNFAGVSQGVLDAMTAQRQQAAEQQQAQMRQQQIEQEGIFLNQARQQYADQQRARAGIGNTLQNMTGGPPQPPQQAPAPPPGQPSVPMGGPPQMPPNMPQQAPQVGGMPMQGVQPTPPQPKPPIPPYQTLQGLQQRAQQQMPMGSVGGPPQPGATPQQPSTNAGGFKALTPQAMMQSLKAQGVPPDQWIGQLELAKPLFDEAGRQALDEMKIQKAASDAAYKTMQAETARLRAELYGSRVGSQNAKDKAGKGASAGNMNQFASRETAELKPINLAQQQSQEIRGMLATDDPAASPQIQKLLTQYLQSGRQTNLTLLQNKGFGTYPERLQNTIAKLFKGQYSDVNKAQILELLDKMDKTVFDPARAKVVGKFKKQAKAEGIDPTFAEDPNAFQGDEPAVGGDQDSEAVAWAKANPDDPRSAKIMEHNSGL